VYISALEIFLLTYLLTYSRNESDFSQNWYVLQQNWQHLRYRRSWDVLATVHLCTSLYGLRSVRLLFW